MIRRYRVDPNTDAETLECVGTCLADCIEPDDTEYENALAELIASGRVYVGGGAAPLFVVRGQP